MAVHLCLKFVWIFVRGAFCGYLFEIYDSTLHRTTEYSITIVRPTYIRSIYWKHRLQSQLVLAEKIRTHFNERSLKNQFHTSAWVVSKFCVVVDKQKSTEIWPKNFNPFLRAFLCIRVCCSLRTMVLIFR